jgi:hypothetical protein
VVKTEVQTKVETKTVDRTVSIATGRAALLGLTRSQIVKTDDVVKTRTVDVVQTKTVEKPVTVTKVQDRTVSGRRDPVRRKLMASADH